MPTIPNFPPELLEEHKNWHHSRRNVDIDNPPGGYGLDFLQFHRNYIAKALDWYRRNGLDPRLVEPWTTVPEPIRQAACYDRRAEARIVTQPASFASADELGRFLEASDLHGCIHREAARLYGEPDINDFDEAPRNTVFYNIHGMVDRWYRNWEGLGRFAEQPYWCGRFAGEREEVLYYSAADGCWWLGTTEDAASARAGVSALEWAPVGHSREFGAIDDGRPFRVWDSDGDGKLEVLFRHPAGCGWVEGKLLEGRLRWRPLRA